MKKKIKNIYMNNQLLWNINFRTKKRRKSRRENSEIGLRVRSGTRRGITYKLDWKHIVLLLYLDQIYVLTFIQVLILERIEESLVLLADSLCWDLEDVVFLHRNARYRHINIHSVVLKRNIETASNKTSSEPGDKL